MLLTLTRAVYDRSTNTNSNCDVPATTTGKQVAPACVPAEGIPSTMHERTFFAIKPDGVQRKLLGTIISRLERKGLKLVAMKLLTPTLEQAATHYADQSEKEFFQSLVAFFQLWAHRCHGVGREGRH